VTSTLIAFDLDGTLIDSRRDLADAANALIAELGGEPLSEDAIGSMVGEGAAVLVRRALRAARVLEPPDAVARFLALYDTRLLNHTRLYDGVIDASTLRANAPWSSCSRTSPRDRASASSRGSACARCLRM
jgi:phosphoglycolate phosphatase-like HAD superfamily hydrolase